MSNNISIEEGNKLIAEFMMLSKVKGELYPVEGVLFSASGLKYCSSWDWLMPACKKFDTIFDGYNWGMKTSIYQQYVSQCDSIDNAVTRYDIEPAWTELIAAITWYNNKTHQT